MESLLASLQEEVTNLTDLSPDAENTIFLSIAGLKHVGGVYVCMCVCAYGWVGGGLCHCVCIWVGGWGGSMCVRLGGGLCVYLGGRGSVVEWSVGVYVCLCV